MRWRTGLVLAAVSFAACGASAQVYRAGLTGLYVTIDPRDPDHLIPGVTRVDPYPWFYQVPRDLRSGDITMRRSSEYPWPQEVAEKVDLRSMLVVWNGFLFVPRAGSYGFQLLADDMALLAIDGRPVLSHMQGFFVRARRGWSVASPTVATIELPAGMHQVELVYANVGDISGVFLRWQRPGDEGFGVIPAESLLHAPNARQTAKRPAEFGRGPKLIGSGTGFVVHPDGWVLTCHHVVSGEGYPSLLVGGDEVPAEIVATDAGHDLALLKAARGELTPVRLGEAKSVARQMEVLCFGYPLADLLGLDLSTENGRITAVRERDGQTTFQTNAPVKPGNSGGPMVNLRGEVLGVVNARLEVDGNNEGVAFAVPISYAVGLLKRIPEFTPKFGGAAGELSPAEVDQLVSPSVLPVLMRQERAEAPPA